MSEDFWYHMRGSSGDPSAPGLGYDEYKRKRALQEQIERAERDSTSERNRKNHPQGSGYKPFAATENLIENMPGGIVLIFCCAGMVAAVVLLHVNFPAILASLLSLEAGWLTWLAFPAAAIGGFFAGMMALGLIIYAIDWLLQAAIVASIIAVIFGLFYLLAAG